MLQVLHRASQMRNGSICKFRCLFWKAWDLNTSENSALAPLPNVSHYSRVWIWSVVAVSDQLHIQTLAIGVPAHGVNQKRFHVQIAKLVHPRWWRPGNADFGYCKSMLVTLNFSSSFSLNIAVVLVDEQYGLSTCLQVCPTDLRCPKVIAARCRKLAFLMGKQGLQEGHWRILGVILLVFSLQNGQALTNVKLDSGL